MKLKQVKINKYKCFIEPQALDIDQKITVLVGMNESGKSAILEALAKTNYFNKDDQNYKFDVTLDYPRREKKRYEKSGEIATVVECKYSISKELVDLIAEDLGPNVFSIEELDYNVNYDNKREFPNLNLNIGKFLANKIVDYMPIIDELSDAILKINGKSDLDRLLENELIKAPEEDEKISNTRNLLKDIQKYFSNSSSLENNLNKYVETKWIIPSLPKYLHYDEYYMLPSKLILPT